MRQPLRVSRGLVDEVVRHAAAAAPREACGLLSGDARSGLARTFRPARNVAESAFLYRMDPGEVVRLVGAISAAGEELLAIVHSHPASAPRPSATDVREAAWPDVRHLIVSLVEGLDERQRARAWWIRDGAVEEAGLSVEEVPTLSSRSAGGRRLRRH